MHHRRYLKIIDTHKQEDGEARCCFHACSGAGPCCPHCISSSALHRRLQRRDRQQPAHAERRRQALQVQRNQRHANLRAGEQRPQGAQRHGHRPHHGRRQSAPQPRQRPLRRGRLGQGQRGALPGRLLPLHRRRQRGHGQRRPEDRPPGHEEHASGARRRRPRRPHQGVHVGAVRRCQQHFPALQRRVRGPIIHGSDRELPGEHRRAAAGQRVPLLRLQRRPAEHPAQLRHLRAGHHRDRQRPHLHEPLRRHGRLHLRRAGESRHAGGQGRRVRERVAVSRWVWGDGAECAGVQSGVDQACRQWHAQEPHAVGDLHFRHVQREREGRGRDGEELWAVQTGQVAGLPHYFLSATNAGCFPFE